MVRDSGGEAKTIMVIHREIRCKVKREKGSDGRVGCRVTEPGVQKFGFSGEALESSTHNVCPSHSPPPSASGRILVEASIASDKYFFCIASDKYVWMDLGSLLLIAITAPSLQPEQLSPQVQCTIIHLDYINLH
jgi:hypothetical protein